MTEGPWELKELIIDEANGDYRIVLENGVSLEIDVEGIALGNKVMSYESIHAVLNQAVRRSSTPRIEG